ncbi:MAG: flagellar basal body P-ring protein FlgI [Bdellovibrionales bacterium]|nr:flagellar basal body P-ring protein FlgI [Bdellovibrionales bacterium]
MKKISSLPFWCSFVACFVLGSLPLEAARLKDVARLKGVRDNQLWGYGLVVGLAGTGDNRHEITEGSLNLMLKGLGVDLKSKKVETKNAAAVLVSAKLRPFMGSGGRMDVTVSSIGSATSLEGGTLVMAPLQAADGKVYAIAEGKIITNMRTGKGTKFLRQSLVTGYVPEGALLEKEVKFDFAKQRSLRYLLNNPDFTTATRVAHGINTELGARWATAKDAGTVDLDLPEGYVGNPVELAARIENVDVQTDQRATIVINQRTGTVIMGKDVAIAPSSISHNNLRIDIEAPQTQVPTENAPNQPPVRGLSSVQARDLDGGAPLGSVIALKGGTNVSDVAASLNSLGAAPDDLILILQALKASGALTAEVITR